MNPTTRRRFGDVALTAAFLLALVHFGVVKIGTVSVGFLPSTTQERIEAMVVAVDRMHPTPSTPDQLAFLDSPATDEWTAAKIAKDSSGGTAFRIWNCNLTPAEMTDDQAIETLYVDTVQASKGDYPHVGMKFSSGKTIFVPLPKTEADWQAFKQKYGGK